MPTLLPNVYVQPNDVYDYLGSEGANLRMDDHNLATGQNIQVTADTVIGATVLPVSPILFNLLNGTKLTFDGGGMPAASDVFLAATAVKGQNSLTVQPLVDQVNNLAAAFDSGVNVALAQRLIKACIYATSQVNLYCLQRYDQAALLANAKALGSVNRWATVYAARWMCKRRSQACPQGIQEDWNEVKEELKSVKFGVLSVEGIGTRSAGWPFISNITVDVGYDIAKARVEQPISELTPTQYSQYVDWAGLAFIEY